jgi:hypothetical protein
MQKTICIAVMILIGTSVFSQSTPSVPTDYLQKSKNQKTAAFVLLGGGPILIITGFLIGDSKNSSFGDAATGAILGGVGVLSALGSIPLFIASARNKRKANTATAFFKMETVTAIQQHSFVQHSYPAVSLRFTL